jgi:hypothetical protein
MQLITFPPRARHRCAGLELIAAPLARRARAWGTGSRLEICKRILLALLVLSPSCTGVPPLRPYDERTNNQYLLAPLIVLGLAESDERIGRPVPSPPHALLQLHKVTVHVENVLKGAVPEHTIAVYYFTFANLNEGWRFLIFRGEPERRVLWLRRDRGVYRMACDCQNCTVRVESGAHPGYRPDPGTSLDQMKIDLLLTRGEGPVNSHRFAEEMSRAVGLTGMDGYTIEKLRNLALTESTEVKYTACEWLWSYSNWKIGNGLRESARDSVNAAGCTCGFSGSNVVCK